MMISIIIPLYNKEQSINLTLQSVLSQDYKDFEIIVVNDGSTDGSLEEVKKYQDKRLRCITIENQGVANARCVGIELARFEYIALLDGDDVWKPAYLSAMLKLVEQCPNAALYGCGYAFQYNDDGSLSIPHLCIDEGFSGYVMDYWNIAKDNTLFTSSSILFSKAAYNQLGGFNRNLICGEDIDLWFRFALNYPVAFLNTPLVIYRLQAENRSDKKKIVGKEKSLIWNLGKYREYELSNSDFKKALDGWRMANVIKFLNGNSYDIDDIRPILKEVDLSNRSFIWNILSYVNPHLAPIIYKTYSLMKHII